MSELAFKRARVVRSSWLQEDGRRLDCNPYMSGALEARDALREMKVRKDALHTLTSGYAGGIYNGPMFRRNYVNSPEHGVPFISSGTMLLADLSTLPLLRRADAESSRLSYLRLTPGTTLISCSGTIGRMCYVRPDMRGIWSSQDVLKVVADPTRVPPGYLYAFLSSRFGVPLVVSGTYGAIIQHIEPEHIESISIPRLGASLEVNVDRLIERAAGLRASYQRRIVEATGRILSYAGVDDCAPHLWQANGTETGFTSVIGPSRSMRAVNYSPKVGRLLRQVERSGAVTLADICREGQLATGARFKRIDCAPEEGVRLVGQKQAFWMKPEGRWIAARYAPAEILARDESVLIASSGTLGDNEVYCRPILVTGRWLQFAYSQHFLRVVSGDPRFSGAYLFAFLRSEIAFRALRSMSTGSKQQEIHIGLVRRMPVPLLDEVKRSEVEGLVREAFRSRDEADSLEAEAVTAVEKAIAGGS